MKILSVNAGSSSLKFQLYEMPEEKVLISGVFERIGMDKSFYTIKFNGEKIKKEVELNDHNDAVHILSEELLTYQVVQSLEEIEGIGHRVVHGGDQYTSSVVITDEVIEALEALCPLAPLHNPADVLGIKAFKKAIPNASAVAIFDTAFQQTMPEVSYMYGIPYEWYQNYHVRRYGFHGISHCYITERMKKELGRDNVNLITCHLGNGASIEAIKEGSCIDASLGFSPNSGLIMGTRSGDIDAFIIPFVMGKTGMSLEQVLNDLNKKSGFLGISGKSSDSRDIEDGIAEGDARCILAQDMYIKRAISYIAQFYAELEGNVDAICFTAGLGENSILTRERIMKGLACFGIEIDDHANNVRGEFRIVTSSNSKIPCYVVPTDEEVMMARDTLKLIA